MLTSEHQSAAGAPFRVRPAGSQDVHVLRGLIMKHRRACPDLSGCRVAEALTVRTDAMGADEPDGLSGIWVLSDASSNWIVAAAHAEVRLGADAIGRLLVEGLLGDPNREDECPRELLTAWLTHWSSCRPAGIREIHVRIDCPLAQARARGEAVHRSETSAADHQVQQVDVRLPRALPKLAAMVTADAVPPASGVFEVLPARAEDHTALAGFLRHVEAAGRPEDYTRPRSQASGRLLLAEGRLTAAFTMRLKPVPSGPSWPGVAKEKPALRLERLRIGGDGRREILDWLTGWAGSYAATWRLTVLEMPVTDRAVVRELEELRWWLSQVRTTSGGLAWVMQHRHQPVGQHTPGGASQ
ncbi:hypothetical protein ACFCXF_03725 [Streptomyces virginiae]|uniref:hypothetical protein n=1 Tax=Streptomyces virginiae TaxID=1961 RepID=UPI0035E2172A